MAAAAILKNRKLAISRPRFERFRRNLARWRSLTLLTITTVKIWDSENPRWRRPSSWKIEKSPYFGRSLSDFDGDAETVLENASMENISTKQDISHGWKMQLRICRGGKRQYLEILCCLVEKTDGIGYCTATNRTMITVGDDCVNTLLTKSCMSTR